MMEARGPILTIGILHTQFVSYEPSYLNFKLDWLDGEGPGWFQEYPSNFNISIKNPYELSIEISTSLSKSPYSCQFNFNKSFEWSITMKRP